MAVEIQTYSQETLSRYTELQNRYSGAVIVPKNLQLFHVSRDPQRLVETGFQIGQGVYKDAYFTLKPLENTNIMAKLDQPMVIFNQFFRPNDISEEEWSLYCNRLLPQIYNLGFDGIYKQSNSIFTGDLKRELVVFPQAFSNLIVQPFFKTPPR